jgi:tetratricopeptide (TPR) repeat protein
MGELGPRALLREGDERAKRGDVRGAVTCYARVAEHYRAEGFMLKAVAAYKQIVALAPDSHEASVGLADIYSRLGLRGDAIAVLEALAGRVEGPVLIEIIRMQPDHPARTRLQELTSGGPFR